jgi:ABC-type transporter Mla subunit MlaD
MMLSFAGDAIVALLLIATIGYSVVLNRRLGTVRNDREKFEVLVRNLNAASQRAEAAVAHLRATADDLSRRLEKKAEEARSLADDLTYMIERGGGIADKLANQIRAGRDELKPDYRPEPKPIAKPQARDEHRVEPVVRAAPQPVEPARTEPALRSVQGSAAPRPAFVRAEARAEPIRVEPRVTVSAVPAAASHVAEQPLERAAAPSRAERDLLRALATRRR